jgi:hypothetical protein
VRVIRKLHEALVDERGDSVERVDAEVVVGVADRLDGFECAATLEDSEPPEEALFVFVEEVVAPVDGGAERSLARGEVLRTAGEKAKAVLEPVENGLRGKMRDTGRRELYGEGQAVEAAADGGDGEGVGFGEGEIGLEGARAVGEELNRFVGGYAVGREVRQGTNRVVIGEDGREGKGRDGEIVLAGNAQQLATGDEHLEVGRGLQQVGNVRGSFQHLLEVVEEEEQMPLGQVALQGL